MNNKNLSCKQWRSGLLIFLLLFAATPLQFTLAQVTLNTPQTTLGLVIKEIQSQKKYKFFYDDAITTTPVKAIKVKNAPIKDVLKQLIDDTGISYEISDNVIYLKAVSTQPKSQQSEKKKISGRIIDENGEPMIGVTVKVKGTNDKTVTDIDGNYTIITAEDKPVLTFSYLGYKTKEINVGERHTVNTTLDEDTKALSEVVVTALGIRKEAKALSYNVQQVNSDELTAVKDANFMNALVGKVAGVTINTSSAGVGGGVKVVMRGAKSLSNNNNALYVIDGIPMPSLQTTQPSDFYSGMGQSGDGAAMVNPEDIESLSVLSGAAASALYGSDAQNGVIMITTKKGKEGRTNITYANNTTFMSPFVTPDFQNTYGSSTDSFSSWGSKLTSPSSYNPLDFFQTGWNTTNSLTLSTGTGKNQTFASLATTNAEGLVLNNLLNRYNFNIRNTSSLFNDKVKLDLSAMYMNIKEQNMVSEGQYFNPIVETYLLSPSSSLETYQLFEMYDAARNFKTQYWPWGNMGIGMQNPYWITQRDKFVNHKNRFLLSGGLSYDIAKGIKITGRAKLDYTSTVAEKKYAASTDAIFAESLGAYYKANANTRQIYSDIILSIDKYFGEDWSLAANLGVSINDVAYDYSYVGGNLNSVANLFSLNNIVTFKNHDDEDYHDQTQSIFATAQLGWKSKVYIDVTARNDWATGLAWSETKSVVYPSIGLSAILTDVLPIKSTTLSFLKIRGSYSEVGNAPQRYKTYQTYPFESGTPTTQTSYPNTDLKPERTKAWELGVQTNFWGDKLNLNVSIYKTSTYNQLFNPSMPSSSGYSTIYINGGRVDNKGLELSLTLNQPIGPVEWNSTFTYTINSNKIKKLLSTTTLTDGTVISQDHLDLISIGNVMSRVFEGGSIGDLWVTTLKRDSHGEVQVNYVDNTVEVDHSAGPLSDGYVYAGNSQAKYRMGWRNRFAWNGLSFECLINARVGGVGVSLTQALMDAYGTSQTSADARDAGGVNINGHLVPAAQKWYQTVGNGAGAYYVYSATNVRLAELSFGYDVPLTKYVPFIKGMNVAFIGRNLFMFYCKAPYDPELTASTGTHFDGMDFFMLPSLRNLGFSVKLNF